MLSRNQISKNPYCRFSDFRHIEELYHEGQIDIETEDIIGANLTTRTEASDPAKHGDALNAVLILKQRQDLLHEGFSTPVVSLVEVNADH